MHDAVLGAVLLHVLGVGFLAAAASSWLRRRATGAGRRPGVAVNALIAVLAMVDAGVTVVDEPFRLAQWSAGVLLAALVVGVVVVRHRRPTRRRSATAPPGAVPAPRTAEADLPLTSTRT